MDDKSGRPEASRFCFVFKSIGNVYGTTFVIEFVCRSMSLGRFVQVLVIICLMLTGIWCFLKLSGVIGFVSGNIGLQGSVALVNEARRLGNFYLAGLCTTVILGSLTMAALAKRIINDASWAARLLLGLCLMVVCDFCCVYAVLRLMR